MKNNIGKLTVTLGVLALLISGCTPNPKVEIIKKISPVNTIHRGFCIAGKTNVANIVTLARKTFGSDYLFDGTKCGNYKIDIKKRRCFYNITEIKQYIYSYTGYSMLINSDTTIGIKVDNIRIGNVFSYLNSRGSKKKIKYLGDNIHLKNKRNFYIKTFANLEYYISQTTPFYLQNIKDTSKSSVYILRYKKAKQAINSTNSITDNLKETEALVCQDKYITKTNKRNILKRLKTVLLGVKNYANYK